MKDLCKAMGICFHEYPAVNFPWETGHAVRTCSLCGSTDLDIPSPTDEAFCWRVLQWLRSDWKRWDSFTFYAKEKWDPDEYSPKGIRRDFTEWLLDPARFIGLCDGWCRDHEEARS